MNPIEKQIFVDNLTLKDKDAVKSAEYIARLDQKAERMSESTQLYFIQRN